MFDDESLGRPMLMPSLRAAALTTQPVRGGGREGPPRPSPVLSALQRRIVARVDRLREEPLLVIGPELADVLVCLDRRVDELVTLLLAPPDVEAADDVAEVVEAERAARRVGERHRPQRLDQRLLV